MVSLVDGANLQSWGAWGGLCFLATAWDVGVWLAAKSFRNLKKCMRNSFSDTRIKAGVLKEESN